MKKLKILKKHCVVFCLVLLLLPFSLKAEAASETSPFLGNPENFTVDSAFRLNNSMIKNTRAFNYNAGLYWECCQWGPSRQRLIDLLPVVKEIPYDQNPVYPNDFDYGNLLKDPEEFQITFQDGSRIKYTFYERGIGVEGETLDGKPLFPSGFKKVDPEIYSYFLKYIKTDGEGKDYMPYHLIPAWLGTMNEKRIQSVQLFQKKSGKSQTFSPNNDGFDEIVHTLQQASCEMGSYRQLNKPELSGDYTIKIEFQSGVIFTINITSKNFEIMSSNMSYVCSYQLNPLTSVVTELDNMFARLSK